jgi:D-glutamate N-acetyltransferase
VMLAEKHDARLWDVRDPPSGIPLFSGKNLDDLRKVVLTVGSDCAVGKMTAALELVSTANAAGTRAEFIATGQTGILIAGWGIAVDRVIADFLAGSAEKLIDDADRSSEVLVVEGQGSLWHPAYAGVTLGLLHGSAPHVLVLCHQAGRRAIEEPPYTRLPALRDMVEAYEVNASTVRPAPVAAIAMNCQGLDDDERQKALKEVEEETELPAADPFHGGAAKLWAAVASSLDQSR